MKNLNKLNQWQDILNMYELGKISTVEAVVRMTEYKQKIKIDSNGDTINENIESIMLELEEMIGLFSVKKLVKEIEAYVLVQQKRQSEQLATEPIVLHMIFKGNPGTGKTTVARILGKLFCAMGFLEKGHLIEIERADLVGEYIGHTAVRVREQIKKSLGGVMFIDEAYSLARGGEKDFGKEAIDALVKGMEDYKDNLVLILAGYKEEMEIFLKTNPGLKSRFPIHIDFPDYSLEELSQIAEAIVNRRQYKLSISAKAKLSKVISLKRIEDPLSSGNARLVRNVIERAIRKQAVRIQRKGSFSRDDLIILTGEDISEED